MLAGRSDSLVIARSSDMMASVSCVCVDLISPLCIPLILALPMLQASHNSARRSENCPRACQFAFHHCRAGSLELSFYTIVIICTYSLVGLLPYMADLVTW